MTSDPPSGTPVLDNPVTAALAGPQAGLAVTAGVACRFPADVCPFMGLPDEPDEAAWESARALIERTAPGWLVHAPGLTLPPGWEAIRTFACLQMTGTGVAAAEDPEAVTLGPADIEDMLDLTRRTEPGPFLPRTPDMGRYLGLRIDGRLVAMAGERLRPPGWTEISAVCTDPAVRGRGLAGRLMRAVAAGAASRGDRVFLHVLETNTGAISLYQRLGFTVRRKVGITGLRPGP